MTIIFYSPIVTIQPIMITRFNDTRARANVGYANAPQHLEGTARKTVWYHEAPYYDTKQTFSCCSGFRLISLDVETHYFQQ
jgi:hypothetical protein